MTRARRGECNLAGVFVTVGLVERTWDCRWKACAPTFTLALANPRHDCCRGVVINCCISYRLWWKYRGVVGVYGGGIRLVGEGCVYMRLVRQSSDADLGESR
jgi:hypothetical protein